MKNLMLVLGLLLSPTAYADDFPQYPWDATWVVASPEPEVCGTAIITVHVLAERALALMRSPPRKSTIESARRIVDVVSAMTELSAALRIQALMCRP